MARFKACQARLHGEPTIRKFPKPVGYSVASA